MDKIKQIAEAIFIVNRHSKTALDPTYLYQLKQAAIQQLIQEGHAKKIGLQYTNRPKNCRQHSLVLVQCSDLLFHIPPTKTDLKALPHLGKQVPIKRTTKISLSLKRAKYYLETYTHIVPVKNSSSSGFESSSPYFR